MQARRSTFSHALLICATARRSGENIGTIPEGLYPGEYLKSVGEDLAQAHGPSLNGSSRRREWLPIVRKRAIDMMMAEIRNDLQALGIVQDEFFSERSLIGKGADRVARDHRIGCRNKATSTKGVCHRRKAALSRTGRIANRLCFVRRPSATMSTGH